MKRIVVLTGAGISAESGLKTFRDSDGLWEGYNIEDVATPQAWARNPAMVQQFYNERRKSVLEAKPNAAHLALAGLEKAYDVTIVTQNIDDLHERAGSTNVLHLHGVITRSQSSLDPTLTYPIDGWEIKMGDKCELGSQLRAHVVWFGEDVPMISKAAQICQKADIFILVGSSLAVYPAAGLVNYVRPEVPKYIVDPVIPDMQGGRHFTKIEERASVGVPKLVRELIENSIKSH
ncbi:SIR2 family NAD-dependent protein deacylase [Mucilaginibacter myungsuensis]|uniref:NAD-dependent protein deacylase n=1 Tax=Mucilaginibacter myungsuensis TaxID=649104 RepID=A0A929L2G8_9SPHI|nr:NAD-dependent deacylase [Mucilaginibacter myungsuensis]MBE9664418.1 NAD-dependent deacylase [Mucilaginibacter myungsuensis]MDN3597129.1 NAD-dependent deacylase [Mucilaginibacter myungsuensis]